MYTTLESQQRTGKDRATELLEEIAILQNRLHEMGMDGDCAYERAMSRLYLGMVEERRKQLADLYASTLL